MSRKWIFRPSVRRVSGISILFASVRFIHTPSNIRRPVGLASKNTTPFGTFFEEPTKEIETCGRNRQMQSFSTSHARVIGCQDSKNVFDSGEDLTSRARPARNASALRRHTLSG